MPDLPTRTDYFNIGADEILARSEGRSPENRINPDEIFTEGSDINIVVASSSAMAEEVTRQHAMGMATLFMDSGEGEDLERYIQDRFSRTIVKKGATPAVGQVSFSRSGGALDIVDIDSGSKLRTTGGTEFKTRFAVAFAAGQTGPITVEVEAVSAGIAGNVPAGSIIEFVEPPSDPEIQVTNEQATAGGDDTETDASLRERGRRFFRSVRRGILGAIEFGALTVPGVRQANVIEDVDSNGQATGRISLFIADSQGQGNTVLVNTVRAALLEYRAGGVVVDVFSSTPVFVPIQYLLRFDAGTDTTEAFASVQLATLAAVNRLQPNETLTQSLLFTQASSVPGVIVQDDALVTPVGDLVPNLGEVIRTRLDLITSV